MASKNSPTAWVGWVYFGGAMMVAVGLMQVVAGLVAIYQKAFYAVTSSHLLAFNFIAWGWIDLVLGVIIVLAGLGVWVGLTWARVIGVLLAILVLIDNIAFINAYPVWAVISVVISGFVIYALTLHGSETRN